MPVTVTVRGLEFYGYHGVPPEERALGHRLQANLDLTLHATATESDNVSGTIDYIAAANIVLEVSQERSCHTLEHLAAKICDRLFQRFPTLDRVRLEIQKPMPPAPVIVESVGVILVRERA
jgi:dihydroneopterin aldolase